MQQNWSPRTWSLRGCLPACTAPSRRSRDCWGSQVEPSPDTSPGRSGPSAQSFGSSLISPGNGSISLVRRRHIRPALRGRAGWLIGRPRSCASFARWIRSSASGQLPRSGISCRRWGRNRARSRSLLTGPIHCRRLRSPWRSSLETSSRAHLRSVPPQAASQLAETPLIQMPQHNRRLGLQSLLAGRRDTNRSETAEGPKIARSIHSEPPNPCPL